MKAAVPGPCCDVRHASACRNTLATKLFSVNEEEQVANPRHPRQAEGPLILDSLSVMALVRGAAVGIKPGVKRSETPGSFTPNPRSPRSGRLRFDLLTPIMMIRLSAAPRTLSIFDTGPWGFAALHPRAGSPAEQLGWGARLYALGRSAGSQANLIRAS